MTGATAPQRFLLIADWGLSQNSSVTLQHILQSAANTTTAPAVLYIADFCYAGEPIHHGYGLTASTVYSIAMHQERSSTFAPHEHLDVVSKMFMWCKCTTAPCTKSSLRHHKLPGNMPVGPPEIIFTKMLDCIDFCFSGLFRDHSTFHVLIPQHCVSIRLLIEAVMTHSCGYGCCIASP